MERLDLRRALLKFDIKTNSSQSDDDLRDLLREKNKPVTKAKPKAAPATKAKAKKKPAEVTDDELEDLDIDDL